MLSFSFQPQNVNMGKTAAEMQRAYRERKKQREGEGFLQKERERVRGYYIPSDKLPPGEREKRNESRRISNQKCLERKKAREKDNAVTSEKTTRILRSNKGVWL